MSKKEGKGLKSFNKGFQVPDTNVGNLAST